MLLNNSKLKIKQINRAPFSVKKSQNFTENKNSPRDRPNAAYRTWSATSHSLKIEIVAYVIVEQVDSLADGGSKSFLVGSGAQVSNQLFAATRVYFERIVRIDQGARGGVALHYRRHALRRELFEHEQLLGKEVAEREVLGLGDTVPPRTQHDTRAPRWHAGTLPRAVLVQLPRQVLRDV